jgi:hypothetical protein
MTEQRWAIPILLFSVVLSQLLPFHLIMVKFTCGTYFDFQRENRPQCSVSSGIFNLFIGGYLRAGFLTEKSKFQNTERKIPDTEILLTVSAAG